MLSRVIFNNKKLHQHNMKMYYYKGNSVQFIIGYFSDFFVHSDIDELRHYLKKFVLHLTCNR